MQQGETRKHGVGYWLGAGGGVAAGLAVGVLALSVVQPGSKATVASPKTQITASVSASTSASAAPSDTPSLTPPASPSPVVTLVTSLPKGSYLAIVRSMPKGSYTLAQAGAEAASRKAPGHTFSVVDSDAVSAQLNHGTYSIAVTGLSSWDEAGQVCASMGFGIGQKCWSREVIQ
jgi:hypothetical protein